MRKTIKISIFSLLAFIIIGCSSKNVDKPAMVTDSQSSTESMISEQQTIRLVDSEDLQKVQYQEWEYHYDDYMAWLPNGEYYARFFTPEIELGVYSDIKKVELYNTDNKLIRRFNLPRKVKDRNYGVRSICNSSFFMISPYCLWKDGKGSFRISDTLQIDWYGNIIREYPEIEEKINGKGEKEYYLEGEKVFPEIGDLEYIFCIYRIDDDCILLIPTDEREHERYPFFYFIPSEGRLIELGEHNREHQSVKTPKGIVWMDAPYLNLTVGDETKTLFDGKEIEYFCTTDEIIAVSLLDKWNPELKGYRRPVLYASLEDMQLKQIADLPWPLGTNFLDAIGHYVIFEDYQDQQGGYRVYNTKTDESWFTEIEDVGSVELVGLRLMDGEPEIILKKLARRSQEGYYVITKDSKTFYQFPLVEEKFINPQYTYYLDALDYSTFSIKPFCRD